MAGGGGRGNPPKPSPSSTTIHRHPSKPSSTTTHFHPSKPSSTTNPSPQKPPNNSSPSTSKPKPQHHQQEPSTHFPFRDPPPPPSYGFHMLHRRTIVLSDGSARSYFALPLDYQDFTPLPRVIPPPVSDLPGSGLGRFDRQFPISPDNTRIRAQDYMGRGGHGPILDNNNNYSLKRKMEEEEEREAFERQKQQVLQYGGSGFSGGSSVANIERGEDMRAAKYVKRNDVGMRKTGELPKKVDEVALKKAFLNFVRLVNENGSQKRNYLADGKQGPLQCLACGSSSKDFPDMHALVMHTHNSDTADSLVDHLALHKSLCVLMGWNYSEPPDNYKTYQLLAADEATANQEDLIIWPPTVIIFNTITGKGMDGRMEGLGNKAMDSILRALGFGSGKPRALYNKDGHMGINLVKFTGDESGLKEAIRLAEHFEKNNLGRKGWARVQPVTLGKEDENNPNLVKVDERTGEKKRIFYGYLGTASDLDKVDNEARKKVVIESKREYKSSK